MRIPRVSALTALALLFISAMAISSPAYADTNGGAIAYMSNSSSCSNLLDCPHYREWNATSGATWSAALVMPTAGSPVRFTQLEFSPTSRKRVIVALSDDGTLDSYVCSAADCTVSGNWAVTNDVVDIWDTAPSGGGQRPYDIAFESKSGDLLVVYDKISADSSQDLFYRIMSNDSDTFGAESNFDDSTSDALDNNYSFVRLATSYSDNDRIGVIALDRNALDTIVWIWNGTLMGYQLELETATGQGTTEVIGIAFERLSGDLIVTSGQSTVQVYNQWTNTTATWGTTATFGTLAIGTVIGISLVPNSTFSAGSNDIYHVVAGALNDLDSAHWSGTAWTDHAEHDAAIDGDDTTRVADFAWASGGSQHGIFAWGTAADSISYKRFNVTNSFSSALTVSDSGTHPWIQFASPSNPTTADIVDVIGATLDSTFDISGLSWNGSSTTLATTGNGGITTDTVVATYESFDVEWQLSTAAPPSPTITLAASDPTPSSAAIFTYQSVAFNGTCAASGGTAQNTEIRIQDNRTGAFTNSSTGQSTVIFTNVTSYTIGSLSGTSANFFFNITANNTVGKYNIRFQCYATNTVGKEVNSTTASALTVSQLNGTLAVQTINQPANASTQIIQNNTFSFNATAICNGANPTARCYQVNLTARRNSTAQAIDTNISTADGATPLFIMGGANPTMCAGDLNASQNCTVNWTVNASGTIGLRINITANASSSSSSIATAQDGETRVINITAIAVAADRSFTIYISAANASGWDSESASSTEQITFNTTDKSGKKVNATAVGGANQSANTALFRYENTGNVNINITLAFGAAPSCAGGSITVKAGWADANYAATCSDNIDANGCTAITTTAKHIANLSVAGARRDVWFWADFSTCNPNLDTSQTLTHESLE